MTIAALQSTPHFTTETKTTFEKVIDEIVQLDWKSLNSSEMTGVAWVYYYFSIQFREHLIIARRLYPTDPQLKELEAGECDTNNLSPWPGVATAGEKMNHDEFMRRALALSPIDNQKREAFQAIGEEYLRKTRTFDDATRAISISSYEDGGLEAIFTAFLTAPTWDTPLLAAFKHFLEQHIKFDSDPDAGHGSLCRHIPADDRVTPLWEVFRDSLTSAVPSLRV